MMGKVIPFPKERVKPADTSSINCAEMHDLKSAKRNKLSTYQLEVLDAWQARVGALKDKPSMTQSEALKAWTDRVEQRNSLEKKRFYPLEFLEWKLGWTRDT